MGVCQLAMSGLFLQDISTCLGVEAMATIKGVTVSTASNFCTARGKKLKQGRSFGATFSERVTDVTGGQGGQRDLLFAPRRKNSGYYTWMRSLKTLPGVVSHSLTPLHMLLHKKTDLPKREGFRRAISDYISGYAVRISCRSRCAIGRRANNCVCKCNGHRLINASCCPTQPWLGNLAVVVERAKGLWGDYFSKTDGFVKVFYGRRGTSTPIIWNNDFPRWNYRVSFGTVDLGKKM